MISIGTVEAIWIGLNFLTLMLTIQAVIEAYRDRRAVKVLNGRAREVAAHGAVRRERFRVVIQVLLLLVAVPSIFSDRDIQWNFGLVALMLVPALLLLSSYMDARERRLLTALVAREARQ